jgi:hypothetical protein
MDPFFSARLTTLGLATADFSREEIFTFFKLLRVINYIKKGLDQNLKERDPFFHEAKTIFKEKKWYAKTKRNSMLLPFSPRVAELISGQDLIVMGFKTGNSIFINC